MKNFKIVLTLLFSLFLFLPLKSYGATACGGANQRACCVTERIPSCNSGMHEVLGCSGNCTCGGANPFGLAKSLGRCVPNPVISPCGGPGQRACCVTERVPSCNAGSIEIPGCTTGNCVCGGANPGYALKSIGHCVSVTAPAPQPVSACGGAGQRACCVGERVPSCNPGFIEVPGCTTGNCTCGGPNPLGVLKSIGRCVSVTAPASQPVSACGGVGQRACCVGERVPSCNPGFIEVPGCTTGNCTCGGPNPLGVLKSIGHCEGGCQPAKQTLSIIEGRKAQLEAELARLNNEVNKARQNVNQYCGQTGIQGGGQTSIQGGGTAVAPHLQQRTLPQMQRQIQLQQKKF